MRVRSLVATVAAVVMACTQMTGAEAQAAAAAPDIQAPYQDGRHFYNGAREVIPDWGAEAPAPDASYRGLGRTDDGRLAITSREYLDDDGSGDICWNLTLWLVERDGGTERAAQKTSCIYDDAETTFGLSDSGDTYYEAFSDLWGGVVTVTVKELDGTRIGQRSFGIGHSVLDLDGSRVVMGSLGGREARPALYVWTIGNGVRRVVTGTVNGADLRGQVQWRRSRAGYWTARALMNPRKVLWRLRFRPVSVSPNGRHTVGLRTNSRGVPTGVVQVRRTADGKLVRSVRPATSWRAGKIGWDGNGAIFGPRDSASGSWLVRCPLTSSCTRAQTIGSSKSFRVFIPQ